MKANELMIGDLVIDSTNCIVRFDGIGCSDYNEINRNNGYPIICDDEDDRYAAIINSVQNRSYNEHLAHLQPIQLTEEILKKNGFEENVYASLHTFYYDKKYIISLFDNIGFSIDINRYNIKIQYVHELQHALRLCGLNELADNFKI